MTDKLPFMQMYAADWLGDECLSLCKPATRGIWADAVLRMHQGGRTGVLEGEPEALARSCRCSVDEFAAACQDLKATKTAGVRYCNGRVILTNRRMQAEHKDREANKARVYKHRHPEQAPAEETPKDLPGNADVMGESSESRVQSPEDREDKEGDNSPATGDDKSTGEDGTFEMATARVPSSYSKGDYDMTRKLCAWIQKADGREIKEGTKAFTFLLERVVAPMRKEYRDDSRFEAVFAYFDTKEKVAGIPISGNFDFKNNFTKLEGRMRNSPEAKNKAACAKARARNKTREE